MNLLRAFLYLLSLFLIISCSEEVSYTQNKNDEYNISHSCEKVYSIRRSDVKEKGLGSGYFSKGLTPCYADWLNEILPKLVFSDDYKVFYKRPISSNIVVNYIGTFTGKVSVSSVFSGAITNSFSVESGVTGVRFYTPDSEEGNIIFEGSKVIADTLKAKNALFLSDNTEILVNNSDCYIQRTIEQERIKKIFAIVKDDSRFFSFLGEDEEDQEQKTECFITALYAYMGASNFYKYSKHLLKNRSFEVVGLKGWHKPGSILNKHDFIFTLLGHEGVPSNIEETDFKQTINTLITKAITPNAIEFKKRIDDLLASKKVKSERKRESEGKRDAFMQKLLLQIKNAKKIAPNKIK